MRVLTQENILKIFKETKKDIYLWGCSLATKIFLEQNKKIKIKNIVDNSNKFDDYLGYEVINVNKLTTLDKGIVLIQGNHCRAIFEQLKAISFKKEIEFLFSYECGAKSILKEPLYIPIDNLSKLDMNVINESIDIDVLRLSHIKKRSFDKKILVPIEVLEEKKYKELSIAFLNKYIQCDKIYVGSGEDFKEGYLHCDIRPLEHIDIVCKAWELPLKIKKLSRIYSRHMLEHLTNKEAILTLESWYECLKTSGELELIVPNFDLRAKEWLECDWEIDSNDTEKEIWSIAGCWGWQRECDPLSEDYNQSYWDVHKSGYNEKRIKKLLHTIGFVNIETKVDEKNNLITFAYKA